ncbi:GNAT family N-acetyltransferase [Leptospira sanjuanensis]|uniref:GNAT family N-acetyltransferase n=1 Tax=Leptospira sanjuanensis TaxID=2879643 RepID=UPI001EE832B0|nr:GNAT family N-acetyltransferase [Leptospira sanjuanensis]MCG6169381.1 GNAT family N-acetyltransferase [Leptospira sanjuanensis]
MNPKVVEITENYVNLHRTLSDLMGAPILNYKSFDFYSNPDSHWFTRIILKGKFSDSELTEEIGDLRSKGHNPDILDFLNTRNHESAIKKLGYDSCNEQVGMFLKGNPVSPNQNRTSRTESIPKKEVVDVRLIADADELKTWLRIVNSSFESDDRENLYLKLIGREGFQLYGGFVNGTMVTTGMSYFDGESFGLYSITTDGAHRGFGFASVLVDQILREIRKEFSGFIILHATKMGQGIYERFGFQDSTILRHWGRTQIH